jgi:hypothetical protein
VTGDIAIQSRITVELSADHDHIFASLSPESCSAHGDQEIMM